MAVVRPDDREPGAVEGRQRLDEQVDALALGDAADVEHERLVLEAEPAPEDAAPFARDLGQALSSRLRPTVAVSSRRPGQVLLGRRLSEVFRVLRPGLLTTIQDIGRPHAVASGVPAGGAMDRFAHAAANLIVGNDRTAATLECTLSGPHLVAERSCLVAITGADFEPRVNGVPAPMWTGLFLSPADELTFGGRRSGARAYVAVAGGIAGERWLGSMSTNLAGRNLAEALQPVYGERILRAIPGPHFARLPGQSREALFSAAFTVSHDSNRMGYRLEGPGLEAPGEELLSFGLVAGAVQLPSGGQPILLMADHQTAGGYPVVITVASASMPVAAQLAPGDEFSFAETPIETALQMRAAQREGLDLLMS